MFQTARATKRSDSSASWTNSVYAIVAASVLIRFVLEIAYAAMMPTEFGYAGFYYAPTFVGTVLSYASVVAIAVIMPKKLVPSTMILHVFFVGYYIPLSMLVAAKNQYFEFFAMSTLFITLLRIMLSYIKVNKISSANLEFSNQFFILISSTFIVITIVLFVASGGLEYVSFDIEDVYTVREDINEILTGFVGYLSDWSKNVFLPIIFILSIFKKDKTLILFSLTMFVIFFAVTSAKVVLIYPIIIVALSILLKSRHALILIYVGVVALACVSHLFYKMYGVNLLSALVTLRTFSVPPSDSLLYYEYFLNHDFLYWSNTILGAPFRTQEIEHIAQTIGRDSWGYGTETFANTGVFATSYMQFGIFGILLYPVLLAVVFKIVDKLAIGRMPNEAAICVSIIPLLQFLGSDFPTAMLSHGVAVLLISMRLLVIEPEKKNVA